METYVTRRTDLDKEVRCACAMCHVPCACTVRFSPPSALNQNDPKLEWDGQLNQVQVQRWRRAVHKIYRYNWSPVFLEFVGHAP